MYCNTTKCSLGCHKCCEVFSFLFLHVGVTWQNNFILSFWGLGWGFCMVELDKLEIASFLFWSEMELWRRHLNNEWKAPLWHWVRQIGSMQNIEKNNRNFWIMKTLVSKLLLWKKDFVVHDVIIILCHLK